MISHIATKKCALFATWQNTPNFARFRAVLPLDSVGNFAMGLNAFQEMVRSRLRERTPNYSTLARFLKVDNSIIQKRMKPGGSALCLDWLDEVSSFYQMSVAEMTALHGSLWQEVKPLETQLLGYFRSMTEHERFGLLAVLGRQAPGARTSRTQLGRRLTSKEQELVDYFSRVKKPGVREGVLETLRGAAQDDPADQTRRPE